MCISELSDLTQSQAARDAQVVSRIDQELLEPLRAEIAATIGGYYGMDERGKLRALLGVNELAAPNGDYLLVDFGTVGAYQSTSCAFYSGLENRLYAHASLPDGYEDYERTGRIGLGLYTPLMAQSDAGGLPSASRPNGIGFLSLTNGVKDFMDEFGDVYASFPVSFKVAFCAEAIRQHVVVSRADACRYVAGLCDELRLQRVIATQVTAPNGQCFGWSVTMRDVMPENKLAVGVAQQIRNATKDEAGRHYIVDVESGGVLPHFTEHNPRRRKPQESTLTLLWFVDEYLPSIGRYVGRNKVEGCKRVLWQQAYDLFNERYPNMYSDHYNFMNSYFNAKKYYGRGEANGH